MNKTFILLYIFFSLKSFSQNNADAIVGNWLKIPKEDLTIQVYKENNEYKGKISWRKENDTTKPVGFLILDNLKYNSKRKLWENGNIYDPNSGNTYKATAKIKADGTLEVYGYMGMKFLGTKKYFKKVNETNTHK